MRRHTSADGGTRIRAGAGPGGWVPNLVTSKRHARKASAPGTRCSRTAGIRASNTRSVRPSRRCGTRRCASATIGLTGAKSEGSSSAPSMAGRASRNSSAPLPHAVQSTAFGAARLIRAVTDPLPNRLVRQIAPSAPTWKHGSRGPRRSGKRVMPGLTTPGNVTVRALPTMCSRRMPQLLDPDDHRFGSAARTPRA